MNFQVGDRIIERKTNTVYFVTKELIFRAGGFNYVHVRGPDETIGIQISNIGPNKQFKLVKKIVFILSKL